MFCNIFVVLFDHWDVEKGFKVLSWTLVVVERCVLLGNVLVRLYDSGLVGIVCDVGLEWFLEVV